jgi:hypothetical protein
MGSLHRVYCVIGRCCDCDARFVNFLKTCRRSGVRRPTLASLLRRPAPSRATDFTDLQNTFGSALQFYFEEEEQELGSGNIVWYQN